MFRSFSKPVIFIIILMLIYNVTPSKQPTYKNPAQRRVLSQYFKHLELIVRFAMKHSDLVDLNFYFGLFLVNVNLESLVKYTSKNIPAEILMKMVEIVRNNEKLLMAFQHRVQLESKNAKNKINRAIFSMMTDVSLWVDRLRSYPSVISNPLVPQTAEDLKQTYGVWNKYVEKIDDVRSWIPPPDKSDKCLGQLGELKPKHTSTSHKPKCLFAEKECYNILVNGTDFGYALTHRLMIILLAHYGRDCSIFEPTVMDRSLSQRLCNAAFSEAEYIATQDFQAIDLMMEQMSLCGMAGYVTPNIRKWMLQILEYQSPFGCFGQPTNQSLPYQDLTKFDLATKMWVLSKKYWEHEMMGGMCNGHTTATAAAAIAVAIRAILTFEN